MRGVVVEQVLENHDVLCVELQYNGDIGYCHTVKGKSRLVG